jgi:hypothetical protein
MTEAMCDFTGESIVFPIGRIETKDSFALQIETSLECQTVTTYVRI